MQRIEIIKNLTIQSYHKTVLYLAFVFFYLEDTSFCLPLEDVMLDDQWFIPARV